MLNFLNLKSKPRHIFGGQHLASAYCVIDLLQASRLQSQQKNCTYFLKVHCIAWNSGPASKTRGKIIFLSFFLPQYFKHQFQKEHYRVLSTLQHAEVQIWLLCRACQTSFPIIIRLRDFYSSSLNNFGFYNDAMPERIYNSKYYFLATQGADW